LEVASEGLRFATKSWMYRATSLVRAAIAAIIVAAIAFSVAGFATAATPVSPRNHPILVEDDPYSGEITSPSSITFTVSFDGTEGDGKYGFGTIWLSTHPERDSSGEPTVDPVNGCDMAWMQGQAQASCSAPTYGLRWGVHYYWWLTWQNGPLGDTTAQVMTTAPATFYLEAEPSSAPTLPVIPAPTTPTLPVVPAYPTTPTQPAIPSYPAAPTGPVGPPARSLTTISTLPSDTRFAGDHSIKQTVLSTLVYKTIERLGLPKLLNVACWSNRDWENVAEQAGSTSTDGQGDVLLGFFLPAMPRWIDLSPMTCADLQGLIDSGQPSGRRAEALTTLIHEAVHAHGVRNEAETNCLAVQLVPVFARGLGFDSGHVLTLSRLALHYVRAHAPSGYWDASRCVDGGAWDIDRAHANLNL
jgi:hypothetical protein